MSTGWKRFFLSTCVVLAARLVAAQSDPGYNDQGFQANRTYVSELPFEHIDAFSGNVILTFTDFTLPGNGGFDLRWIRVYNSKRPVGGAGWSYGLPGVPMSIANADEKVPSDPVTGPPMPVFYTADAAAHPAFATTDESGAAVFLSREFWRYNRQTRIVSLPNGWRARYNRLDTPGATPQNPLGGNVRYLTHLVDPFNNSLVLGYDTSSPPNLTSITQALQNGQSRVVTLGYSANRRTVTHGDRTWTYLYEAGLLTEVVPPAGPSWRYQYTAGELTGVTTPGGGQVTYVIETFEFPWQQAPGFVIPSRVVKTRTLGGRDTMPGTWIYTYGNLQTTVQRPVSDWSVVYGFNGFGETTAITTIGASAIRQAEALEWEYGASVGTDQNGQEQVLRRLHRHQIDRDGVTHSTTYLYSAQNAGDYNRPYRTEERRQGTLVRVTERTFRHLTAPYLKGLLESDVVTIGSESSRRAWSYDANGFATSRTERGITTTFQPDGVGNTYRQIDGNQHTTTFGYEWGTVGGIWKPQADTSMLRAFNEDGTIRSEQVGTRITTFGYDKLWRVTSIEPPLGANSTATNYTQELNGLVTVTRGGATTTTLSDGFGRVLSQTDAVGVVRRSEYDAEGRKTFESYPYEGPGAGIGVHIEYDALGRVTKRTNPDDSTITFTYATDGSGNVDIIERSATGAWQRATTQTWLAFGDPDDARLTRVVDADGGVWTYSYTPAGDLKQVSGPPGPNGEAITRTWTYPAAGGLLQEEHHPESGTTGYGYDDAGNVTSKTDATSTTITFAYDGNNRLTSMTSGVRQTAIGYEPGSDNRQTATSWINGAITASTTWVYDTPGRLVHRSDQIGTRRMASTFGYDGNDQLTGITYASGRSLTIQVDAAGRVIRLHDNTTAADYAAGFTYHPSGAVTSYGSGNGLLHTFTYDPSRYWIRSITAGDLSLTYDNYDPAGNVGTIGDPRPTMTQTFTYDLLDRLRQASGTYGSMQIDYDHHGNRVTVPNLATYQYETGSMRLLNQNGSPFTYFPNGNLSTAPGSSYAYTPDNMLETAIVNGTTTTYTYDVDTWRLKKATGSDASYFARGLQGQLLTEWANPDASSPAITDYIYAGGRLIAEARRTAPIGSMPATPSLPGPVVVPPPPGAINAPGLPSDWDDGQSICLDRDATNYGQLGDCRYPQICTDPNAINVGQPAPCQYSEVIFFENHRSNGASFGSGVDMAFVGWEWNDRISSIHVPANRMLVLYEDADYRGGRLVIKAEGTDVDVPDLKYYLGPGYDGSWNDIVSSFRILPLGTPLGPPQGSGVLAPNERLAPNESRTSSDGEFILIYQASDGNLGLYHRDWTWVWSTDRFSAAPGRAEMQASDGNFVVYDAGGAWVWSTDTQVHPGAYLLVQNNGNVVVYDEMGLPLWEAVSVNRLGPDKYLLPDQALYSADGSLALIYQFDGNLVIYTRDGGVVWYSGTTGGTPGRAWMRTDGSFQIFDNYFNLRLDSMTGCYPGAYLQVGSPDGAIVIYDPSGLPLWVNGSPQVTCGNDDEAAERQTDAGLRLPSGKEQAVQ